MKRPPWLALFAAAFPSLLGAASALARAGGGQGYHGGGGGGHGGGGGWGGGGGGGGGDVIQALFWLLFYHPAFGIPALVVIVLFLIFVYRNGSNAYQSSVIRRGTDLLDFQERDRMLGALRERDPRFDVESFAARVTVAFEKIQWAWSNQNLQAVRPFLSDGVYERFSLQIDEQKALGYRNDVSAVNIEDITIVQVRNSRLFDVLAVRIAARARDVKVSLADGKVLRGSDESGEFVEVWSFLRRRGVVTDPQKPGLIEGNCPNCGGPVEMNQNANCAHCGALLRSGQFDWVLSEITQESEWSPNEPADTPSVAQLMARDPDFDLQDLEDRASVMFWRRAAADRIGKVEPLRKIASPAFCDAFAAELKEQSLQGRRQYYGECAVGSVDTLGILSDEPWDRALVEVRWEGRLFIVSERGPQDTGRPMLSRTVFELARRRGVKTDPGRAISSAHCPNCGAPETGGTSGVCESCGTALNDGRRGWVLTGVRTPEEARQLLASDRADQAAAATAETGAGGAGTTPSAAGMIAWMIQMSLADGQIDERESQMIYRVAQRRNISRERVDTMLAAARASQLDLPTPLGPEESKQWLRAMAWAALADGKLSREEQSLLLATAGRIGLSTDDVKEMLQKLRAEMYARSKQALRDSRNAGPPPTSG
jgi:predicted lipid-binding transport protein (Tim44 family)